MEQEPSTEFHKRWVATAETEMHSAKRKFLIWFCLFISIAAACFSAEGFLPRSGWRAAAALLLCIPFLTAFVKAALSASDLGEAKKFLRKCRGGLANDAREIH